MARSVSNKNSFSPLHAPSESGTHLDALPEQTRMELAEIARQAEAALQEHAYIRRHDGASGARYYAVTTGQGEIVAVFDHLDEAEAVFEETHLARLTLQ